MILKKKKKFILKNYIAVGYFMNDRMKIKNFSAYLYNPRTITKN